MDIKNIIIKNLDEYQISLVNMAKQMTGQKTASRAIFQVLSEYEDLRKRVYELKSSKKTVNSFQDKPKTLSNSISKPAAPGDLRPILQETYDKIIDLGKCEASELSDFFGVNTRTIRDRTKELVDLGMINKIQDGRLIFYRAVSKEN